MTQIERVLTDLREIGPGTNAEISATLEMESSRVATLLLRLIRRGLVDRRPFGDGREYLYEAKH